MKKFRYRYIVFVLALAFLCFNNGAQTLAKRFLSVRTLQKNIESAKLRNARLKKEIYYLEKEPSYLERAVRKNLKVIAPGEVEYRFQTEEEERSKKKSKGADNV